MLTFVELARRTAKFAIDKSPTILTTVAVVGTVTTVYLAGKASFEAADIIRLKEASDESRGVHIDDPNAIMKERLQLVWRLYIPSATMGVATIACIIGANRIGNRRAAGLAAAYAISERAFEQYKEKVIEKIGERKEQNVRDEIAQDNVTATYDADLDVFGSKEGHLCQEKFGLHYFRSTAEKMQAAVNEFNRLLTFEGQASLADFYELLGLPTPIYSEQIGWDINRGFLEIEIGGATAPDMSPILTLDFKKEPTPNFNRFR